MENRIIDHLITNVKLYTGKDLETVGLQSEYENYKVSFYGIKENNYKLVVEDFGLSINQKWRQYYPTDMQLELMQVKLIKAVSDLQDECLEDDQTDEGIQDLYDYFGVKRSNFY